MVFLPGCACRTARGRAADRRAPPRGPRRPPGVRKQQPLRRRVAFGGSRRASARRGSSRLAAIISRALDPAHARSQGIGRPEDGGRNRPTPVRLPPGPRRRFFRTPRRSTAAVAGQAPQKSSALDRPWPGSPAWPRAGRRPAASAGSCWPWRELASPSAIASGRSNRQVVQEVVAELLDHRLAAATGDVPLQDRPGGLWLTRWVLAGRRSGPRRYSRTSSRLTRAGGPRSGIFSAPRPGGVLARRGRSRPVTGCIIR